MKQNKLHSIINKCLKQYLYENIINNDKNNIILYRCYDNELAPTKWIWLSRDFPDGQYGKNVAEFSMPLNKFKIADRNTVLEYIKQYDITCFEDACEDEYIEPAIGSHGFDWNEYSNGNISDEDAYEQIPMTAWTEAMEHPDNYTFAERLQQNGYDGYEFQYIDWYGETTYYVFFDKNKILPYRIKNLSESKHRLYENSVLNC